MRCNGWQGQHHHRLGQLQRLGGDRQVGIAAGDEIRNFCRRALAQTQGHLRITLTEAAQHLGQRVTRLGVRGRDGQRAFMLRGVFARGLLDVVSGIECVSGHGDKLAARIRQTHQPRAVAHE